ncbi:S1-like domain-containing RNA-binding protein [soil metagenome]
MPFPDDLLGRMMRFPILRLTAPGAYVGKAADETDAILVPTRELPKGAKVGDPLEVFVYLDSDDRPIATTTPPALVLGEVTFLEVTEVTNIGAFVAWGPGKELLVPFAEQAKELEVGERHPIGLYVDKTGRLAGTMFVTDMMKAPPRRIQLGAWVVGEAWRNDPDIGLFVILERSYVGLVPATEPHRLRRGERARFRVAHIQPDGKLVLSSREQAFKARASDGETILAVLARPNTPRVGDRSDPEQIRDLFGLSKKAFKRAVGGLLKDRKIELDTAGFVVVVR